MDLHRQIQFARHAQEGMEQVVVQRAIPLGIGQAPARVLHYPVEQRFRVVAGGIGEGQRARIGALILERHRAIAFEAGEYLPAGIQIVVQRDDGALERRRQPLHRGIVANAVILGQSDHQPAARRE